MLLFMLVPALLMAIFFFFNKMFHFNCFQSSIFECGFNSYHFSRFSFSIHYYLIGLIFLFMDLELCFLFPFFINESYSPSVLMLCIVFVTMLFLGLLWEWLTGKMDWKELA